MTNHYKTEKSAWATARKLCKLYNKSIANITVKLITSGAWTGYYCIIVNN